MTWQEGVAIFVICAGLGAGAFLVSQRPSFWIEFGARLGTVLFKALLPKLMLLAQRMPADEEKAWRDCQKRGGRWNYQKRRCE